MLRARRCRRWPYSSRRSSSRQSRVTWLSEPMATGVPASSQWATSVRPSPRLASVLGQIGAGAARGDAVNLLVRHVGGVHQLPATIQAAVLQQPLHRPQASHLQAFFHLGHLLCDVNVDRPLGARPAARWTALAARSE